MTFDIYNIPLTPNLWFSSKIKYKGDCRAEFIKPNGVVFGKASVSFDEFCDGNIEINVKGIESEQEYKFGLMGFMHGEGNEPNNGGILNIGLGCNPCQRISLSTSIGDYTAEGNILCVHQTYSGKNTKITLSPLRSKFDVYQSGIPKYWVMPLFNLQAKFFYQHPEFKRHPLRVFNTPEIPDDLSEDDKFIANLNSIKKNTLIIFEMDGRLGFIEPLPDYDKIIKRLQNHTDRHRLTALMVGEVGDHPSKTFDELDTWFPFNYLTFLELATGNNIGLPWIEILDSDGKLVRRFHTNFGRPAFAKGHTSIDGYKNGIGKLLTSVYNSPFFRESAIKVAIKHVVRSGQSYMSLEDKMVNLCQALDILCEYFGLKKSNTDDRLSPEIEMKIKNILQNTKMEFDELAASFNKEGSTDKEKINNFKRIIENLCLPSVPFGKSVLRLFEKFGLPDHHIIASYYKDNPRKDKRNWQEIISRYRAIPVHSGFYQINSGEHDVDDILTIIHHLQDLLIRILLKIINYDGLYQPVVWKWRSEASIDWVRPDTPASELGYE